MNKKLKKDTTLSLLREIRDLLKPEITGKAIESTQINEIRFPALKRTTLAEVQKDWSYIKSIESDTSTEEAVTLKIITVLKDGEERIDGKELEKRLPKGQLGFQHLQWLIAHQDEFSWLLKQATDEGWWYLLFTGLVVVDDDGSRRVPFAYQGGERWDARWDWLDNDCDQRGRIAVQAK